MDVMSVPTLPHDTFAEQYVLASRLKKPDLIAPCRLQPSDFYHLAHRQAWATILEVGTDLDDLGDALHYGPAYLALWQADWVSPEPGRHHGGRAGPRLRTPSGPGQRGPAPGRAGVGCEPPVDRE